MLCITVMINHVFIFFFAVQIYGLSYIHYLHYLSSTVISQTHNLSSSQLASVDNSVGRALPLYPRGRGFESLRPEFLFL